MLNYTVLCYIVLSFDKAFCIIVWMKYFDSQFHDYDLWYDKDFVNSLVNEIDIVCIHIGSMNLSLQSLNKIVDPIETVNSAVYPDLIALKKKTQSLQLFAISRLCFLRNLTANFAFIQSGKIFFERLI